MGVVLTLGSAYASDTGTPDYSRFHNSMAQTGGTGLLRTPHADVLSFGEINFSYNHEDNIDKSTMHGIGAHNTIMMGLGVFPHVELTVQNTHKEFSGEPWAPSTSSDLSASVKANFDWLIPSDWFQFAVGAQDLGGEASFHETYYAVASKRFHDFRFSLGYGYNDEDTLYTHQMGSDYLSSVFGGVEYQPFSWLQLVSDYDGTGMNAGVKAFTPSSWLPYGLQANVSYQAYSGSETQGRDNQWVGVGLSIPLAGQNLASRYQRDDSVGVDINEPTQLVQQHIDDQAAPTEVLTPVDSSLSVVSEDVVEPVTESLPSVPHSAAGADYDLEAQLLSQKLTEYGFENVSVGNAENEIVVRAENNLFNQNELDAIGVILGYVNDYASAPSFSLYLLNNNIPVIKVSGTQQNLEAIFAQDRMAASPRLQISNAHEAERSDVTWASERENSHAFKPKVILSPSLYSTIGTEVGVFDYSLALSTNVEVPLWAGGLVDVRHLLPVANSDDYEPGEQFGDDRHTNTVDRVLLHQGFSVSDDLFSQVSVGQIKSDYLGGTGELRWQSPEGTHKFGLEASYYEHKNDNNARTATPVLAHYRYYFDQYDWALEANAGEYWAGDKGFKLTSKHWFGDTAVSIFFEHSDKSFAGLNIALPLSFRKDMAPDPIQIRGIEQWTWGYRTMVRNSMNFLDGSLVQEVDLQNKIDRNYYNRDRLSASYINANIERLRDAYLLYR
ncbi:YjbH domain-containing protein [Vibrio astriarenae]